ncbi:MAG: ferrous iron transport protein A [Bacteroidetes bacterium]|jgi:ferrous iron transport protein A|nr:ferrous iron transport protein A [Bacteroidota bacterium]
MITADELVPGMSAKITALSSSPQEERLTAMGCVPGTLIKLEFTAPSGDPMAFNVEGYLLGLRKSEAKLLVVEPTKKHG